MEETCAKLGISMSAAFTIFAKKASREKCIPFEVSIDPFYSESSIRHLKKKSADFKTGRLKSAKHKPIEADG